MHYGNIKYLDIANGEGIRTSLFVSGCRNQCKNCFNKETWNFSYGTRFTEKTMNDILDSLAPDHVAGLTVLGGEPMEEENQEILAPFLTEIRKRYPDKSIWMYTGYLFDTDLQKGGKKHCSYTDEILSDLDILVDGRFIEELKDIRLQFRGSSNQRIIDIRKSLEIGYPVKDERFR